MHSIGVLDGDTWNFAIEVYVNCILLSITKLFAGVKPSVMHHDFNLLC